MVSGVIDPPSGTSIQAPVPSDGILQYPIQSMSLEFDLLTQCGTATSLDNTATVTGTGVQPVSATYSIPMLSN